MKKNLLAVFLLCVTTYSFATIHQISFVSFSYNPNNLTVNVGDTVRWSGSFTTHPLASTVVPAGAATFSNSSGNVFDYVVTVAGTYTYECQNHSSMTGIIVALNTAGISDAGEQAMSPAVFSADNCIRIVTHRSMHSTFRVEIISLLGNLVYKNEMPFSQQELRIDTRVLAQGIYFVRIREDKKIYGKKIVIAR
jgi:hypothetical protein